jgi:hypothetical protein
LEEMPMKLREWMACLVAVACLMVAFGTTFAREEEKKPEVGKGSKFGHKTFEMKDGGKKEITLSFEADKEVTVTTTATKDSDVNMWVYEGKKEVGKDTSPGPKCKVTFTPKKDGNFTIKLTNKGSDTKVTLDVKVAK